MNVSVCGYCMCARVPSGIRGTGSPEAGVAGDSESLHVGAGNLTVSPARAVCSFN